MPVHSVHTYRKWGKRGLLFIFLLLGLFIWVDWLFPFQYHIPYSQVIVGENEEVLHAFLADDDRWRMYTELDEITPELQKAIIAKEDQYFYWHIGVNPVSIGRAFFNNFSAGRTTSGASTITMQVARLLNPKPRTYGNKLLEIFHALQLEWHLSKEEILQLYLNLVPYGGNIEGVKAASLLYFGRNPTQLSLAQVTTLAIVPNRPTSLALGKRNENIVQARNKWLKRFQAEGIFDADAISTALVEPLEAIRRNKPQLTPHLANWLHWKVPNRKTIQTFIDPEMQSRAQRITQHYAQTQNLFGIYNAAVLVVDNNTRQIKAYVGSNDFSDDLHRGQIDGVRAVRSPGSTLKPLLYGTAFDRGMLTPQTVLEDVPIDFEGYAPKNFNREFQGKITVEQALAQSLNLPAVHTLKSLETHRFITQLKQAGFAQVAAKEDRLGLSLALGGCGASLFELVGLYSSFANEGTFQPLQVVEDLSDTAQIQLLSAPSTFMLTEILTQLKRPDLPNGYEFSPSAPKIAWKTGTSHRRRDAWAIGYNHELTIGVWVGNFNGESIRELTGASKAAPLLFEVFNALSTDKTKAWNRMPDGLQFRYVCTESGHLPADFCPHQAMDYFMPQISPSRKCTHMKPVFVSPDESISYCNVCLPRRFYKKKLYPNLSPRLIDYYRQQQIPFEQIPPHFEDCPKVLKDTPPKITSLLADREYILTDGKEAELMLSCQVANDVQTVYWYINDQFLKKTKPAEKVFFKPPLGRLKVSCTDDRGRNTDVEVLIKQLAE